MTSRKNRNQVEDSSEGTNEGLQAPEGSQATETEQETSDGDPEVGDFDDGDPSSQGTTDVAPPLTAGERLALLEAKIDSIGHALHSMATHTKGHHLDAFISEWHQFTKGEGLGDANSNG